HRHKVGEPESGQDYDGCCRQPTSTVPCSAQGEWRLVVKFLTRILIDRMYPNKSSTLDEEIESWKGFPWALRKEDIEVWERMIRGAREFELAIKKSGRWLTTEPFFIAILFLQYKTIRSLEREAERLKKLRRDGKTIT